jgi:MFS family permease
MEAGLAGTLHLLPSIIFTFDPSTKNRNCRIVAVYYTGSLVGVFMAGSFSDRFGRIKSIIWGCLWAILGAALQASARNVPWIMLARVITGIGAGALAVVCPVWSAEVTDHRSRGRFIAVELGVNYVGITYDIRTPSLLRRLD